MTPKQHPAIKDSCQRRQKGNRSCSRFKISLGQDASMRQPKRSDYHKKECAQAHKSEADEDLRELVMSDLVMSNDIVSRFLQFSIAEPRMKARVRQHIAKAVKTIAKCCDPEGLLV